MSTEQTIGVLARYNINWTAGILYLNTIAQALQHLPADNRPGIRLIQTTKEKAKSKNQLAACFHSGALILIMASLGELVFPLPTSGKIRHPLFDQRRERRHPKMRHLIG